jgi:quaternary ammonium compound-resistance protein SugE
MSQWQLPLNIPIGGHVFGRACRVLFANAAIYLLTHSLKSLPVGRAFTVFTGINAIGITMIGIWHFQESASPARLLSIALILTGIVALKLLKA